MNHVLVHAQSVARGIAVAALACVVLLLATDFVWDVVAWIALAVRWLDR